MSVEEQRSEFHEHLDEIRRDVAAVAATVTEMIPRATEIFLTADLEGAAYLIAGVADIDERARAIEERCFSQIALQQPVAVDLRQLVASIKILADIERSAHLCANICRSGRRIFDHELDPRLRGAIQRMGDQGALLFRQCTEAYLNTNEVMALALRDIDAYMDGLHSDLFQLIFSSHTDGRTDLQIGVQLGLVARFYERIGDHAVNIGEHTAYIASGWTSAHPYRESGNAATIDPDTIHTDPEPG